MRNPLLYAKNMIKVAWLKVRNTGRLQMGWIQTFDKLRIEIDRGGHAEIGSFNQNREKLYIGVGSQGNLKIGNHCFFNINSSVTCMENIEIGDNCKFGNNLVLVDHDHNYRAKGEYTSDNPEFVSSPIKIGNNVWVGAGVTILRGTEIGDNSVVGAGTTVKGNYPENSTIIPNVENSIRPIGGGYRIMPKISIIVPVYNAEKTVRECVASIQAQNYSNVEIILVNDGSKDNSLNICRKIAERDSRVIVLDGENAGVSCARNKGIAKASGDYLAFVDADDFVKPEIYEKLLERAEYGYEMVFCNYSEFSDDGYHSDIDQISSLGNESVVSRKVISQLISISETALFGVVWRTLFRTLLVKNNDIEFTPGLTMAEDLQFLLKCLAHVDNVGLCKDFLYEFKVSNQSTTGHYMAKQDSDMRLVNDWLMEYVSGFDENEDLVAGVEICMANTLILNVGNVCKQKTPYSLMSRIKYAYSLTKEDKYKRALDVALEHREEVIGKRYGQMKMMKYHLAFINVFFHTLKNKTFFKDQRGAH